MAINSKMTRRRTLVLFSVFVGILLLTIIQVARLQIFKYKEYNEAVLRQQTNSSQVTAMRGTI